MRRSLPLFPRHLFLQGMNERRCEAVAMPLVVPGGVMDSRYRGSVRELLAQKGCGGRVTFLGYVPHEHMPLLFGNPECFIFPSLLEGCGNALIEAPAAGPPIFCCQRRPMTDIFGKEGLTVGGRSRVGPAESPLRLLILSIRFAPELTSNATVITGLAQALAAHGHQVTVLAGTPHCRLPHVPGGYLFRPFRRESLGGVKIVRCWAFPKSDGKFSKLVNYISFTLTGFLASLFSGQPDAVLAVSPPFWLGFSALFLKALCRCPVIYNAQDLFPEAYLASGEVRPGRLTRAIDRLMTRIYRRCDRITVITASFAEAIARKGIDSAKIQVIPNFVDTSAVAPLPRSNSFSRRWGLDGKFVVMYAGNIGYTHGAELLVEAAEKLAPLENLRFLVIGGGSKQADVERLARERRLANMQFLPTQPNEVLPEMLASADVFVLTTKPGIGQSSFPTRIYSFLLAARPVVASVDNDSDLALLLREAGAGIVTAPGNTEDFCRALATVYYDVSARESFARKGREFMEYSYSPNAVAEQYNRLLKQLAVR